jgi:UDP-3-O-[3-hydroxymyristoyl] glucosamine N-acyltransferase
MTRTARELAQFLAATLEGDPGQKISGIASPESARAEDLIYVDAPKQLERAARSAARCAVVALEADLPGKTLLRVPNPKLAFARAAAALLPEPVVAEGVHATAVISSTARLAAGVAVGPYAVVEEGAEVGAGTQIGAHCVIGRGARVGEQCRLYPHVTLYPGARLGARVVVHSGAVIGGDGFGYVFGDGRYWKFPQVGAVEIGDDVEIGANTCIDRGALDLTCVAQGTKLDNLVQVGHNVFIGEHTVIASQTGISGSSTVGKNAVLGGQVGIADHCHIEDGAICGAQAGVPSGKTVRAGQTVWGTPARPIEKFKEQHAWHSRLPEIGEFFRRLKARFPDV